MNLIELRFFNACREMRSQQDNQGRIRWRYAVNWIISCLQRSNPEFRPGDFYTALEEQQELQPGAYIASKRPLSVEEIKSFTEQWNSKYRDTPIEVLLVDPDGGRRPA